jgi:uncharacterized protein YbjT (DUF2867 family)
VILLTGATGAVGSRVARRLARLGVPARALVRDASRAGELTTLGISVVEGDLSRPESVAPALEGVDTAFLLTPTVPQQAEMETGFIDAARAAGVSLLVKHSAVGADPDARELVSAHGVAERHLAEARIPYRIVRPTQFMQNYLNWTPPIPAAGALVLPLADPDVRVNLVDVDDVADVEAALLTGAGEEGGVYTPTGPELLTYREFAERLSRGVGTAIPLRVPSAEEYRSEMAKAGYPQASVNYVAEYFSTLRPGHTALTIITDDVLRITGHSPRSVEQFAADHAESLRPKNQM